MEKKKFKDTQVGKFLLNKIPSVVGAIAGDTPVGSVIQAIIGGSNMNDSDKQVALEKLKNERAEIDGTTKRWVADAKSGFWLTSNVRPLILILITLSIISGFFLKYDISSLTQLGQVIFSAYFGSRGLEKVFGNKMHK
mgnify:CR=1 FL=1|tara:strand:- start:281 stop:694 length:414 start_codon:yes stop_codon:yes gene_type:complete